MERALNQCVAIIDDFNTRDFTIKPTCKWYQFKCKKKERLSKERQSTLSSKESGYP